MDEEVGPMRDRPSTPDKKDIPPVYKPPNLPHWRSLTNEIHSLDKDWNWLKQLETEIRDFSAYSQPTEEFNAEVQAITQLLKDTIALLWPKSEVKTFGSIAMGLTLPESDIDLVVLGDMIPSPTRTSHPLTSLWKHLKRHLRGTIELVNLLTKIRVPLLTLKIGNFYVDITVNMKSGPLLAEIVKEWLVEYPLAKPLLLFVKQFMRTLKVHKPSHGYIGSYVLFQMIVSMMQQIQLPPSCPISLGWLLCRFFQFYGFLFNYRRVGISLHTGGYFPKNTRNIEFRTEEEWKIAAEDLLDPEYNIGGSSYRMYYLREIFKYTYYLLQNSKYANSQFPFANRITPEVQKFAKEFIDDDNQNSHKRPRHSDHSNRPFKRRRSA
jgi:DNA polymerase sigma